MHFWSQYRTVWWQFWLKVSTTTISFPRSTWLLYLHKIVIIKNIHLRQFWAWVVCGWLQKDIHCVQIHSNPVKNMAPIVWCAHITQYRWDLFYIRRKKKLNLSVISSKRFCALYNIAFYDGSGNLITLQLVFLCDNFSSRSSSASNGDKKQPKYMNIFLPIISNWSCQISKWKEIWLVIKISTDGIVNRIPSVWINGIPRQSFS